MNADKKGRKTSALDLGLIEGVDVDESMRPDEEAISQNADGACCLSLSYPYLLTRILFYEGHFLRYEQTQMIPNWYAKVPHNYVAHR